MRQDGMIPGWSPAGLLLIRTDDVAVAVGGVRGYPNGFEFTVHVRLRQQGFVWGTGPFDSLADPRTARAPEQALRLGVLYANGRRARTQHHGLKPCSTCTAAAARAGSEARVAATVEGEDEGCGDPG
jgi:hypothetical protein